MKRKPLALFTALVIPNTMPDIEIDGFKLVESHANQLSLKLNAIKADIYKQENVMSLDQPRATVFNQSGNPMYISGELGLVDSNTNNVQISKNSQLQTASGVRFNTENIFYDSQSKIATSADMVKGQRVAENSVSRLFIKGLGLNADIEKQDFEVLKDVTAFQTLSSKNKIEILSDSANIRPEENRATFTNNGRVASKNMDITGDKIILYFREKSKKLATQAPRKLEVLADPKAGKNRKIHAVLQSMDINSDGIVIEFDVNGNFDKSRAHGAVEAKSNEGVRMIANELIMTKKNKKQVVELNQDVTIYLDKRLARCDRADYFPDTGHLHLYGLASVMQGEQTLRGERIYLSTRNQEIRVEKATGKIKK